jgi:cytochrome b561
MATKSTFENWGWVTRALHWSIALTVFGMLAAGLYAGSVDQSTPAGELRYYSVIDVHKSFGLTILMLMAFRLLWRLAERTPTLPLTTQTWERLLARTSQVFLYICIFLLPVTGWLWASAYGEPVRFFGLKLPGLIHLNGVPATLAHHIHIITAFILMAIVGLHVMGALKNHFVDRNNVLRKMLGLAPHPVGAARSTD